jgi:hypothetical protein
MTEDKVYFKRNYSINPLLHEHIHLGGEFTILEGQTWEQVTEATLMRVDEFVTKHFPHAFAVTTDVQHKQEPAIQVKKHEDPIANMITAITTCTTIDTLKTFEKLANSKPEFQKAYSETMELLTNKQ